jgi:hypothetical protein
MSLKKAKVETSATAGYVFATQESEFVKEQAAHYPANVLKSWPIVLLSRS